MASSSTLPLPNSSKKNSSGPGLGALTPAPSLLSLRSVIEFLPNDIRFRYKDAAKYVIWPECPLDGNGNALELIEEDELTGSNSNMGTKVKRNFTLNNGLPAREYSKFGNAPVMIPAYLKPVKGRNRTSSDASSTEYRNFAQARDTKKGKPPVAYFSSKDGGDVSVRLATAGEVTHL